MIVADHSKCVLLAYVWIMHRPDKCDVFEYTSADFNFSTNSWAPGTAFERSRFDLELCERWDTAMKGGAFRYDIDHITTRIIPGEKHYVAQLNLLRAKERRKPQDIRSINLPFNPSQFNFTLVHPQEVVFNLRHVNTGEPLHAQSKAVIEAKKSVLLEKNNEEMERAGDDKTESSTACDPTDVNSLPVKSMCPADQVCCVQTDVNSLPVYGMCHTDQEKAKMTEERHMLIINVSPMEYGHCLLIPQIDSCLPQVLTETSIRVVLEMMLLSNHRGFVVGFNSLCAFASVNHLHFHAYYLEHELIVDYSPVTHLVGTVYENTAIPVPGFAFQLHGSTVQEVSRHLYNMSNYFQESDVAHNVFISRGAVFGESRHSNKTTVRVFIWPRRKFVGTKSAEEFNVASIELGGHLPIRELDGYHTLTEETVDAIIADSQLPVAEYEQIKKHIVGMFATSDKAGGVVNSH